MIHVIIPFFQSELWFKACLECLVKRAANRPLVRTVIVNMDEDGPLSLAVWAHDVDRVVAFPEASNMIGGQPIPAALLRGFAADNPADDDIVMTLDTDCLLLKQGWDTELVRLFADPALAVASINPRSDSEVFAGFPEWNCMAFRAGFFRQYVRSFQALGSAGPDIGHRFGHAARLASLKVKLWPMQSRPYADKGATFAGDSPNDLWAFHAFYATRKIKDHIPEEERKWILTPEQEGVMRTRCAEYPEDFNEDGTPCTCGATCIASRSTADGKLNTICKGECGCRKCDDAYQDFLSVE